MKQPYAHAMMPIPTHDEHARQNCIADFKIHMEDHIYPANRRVFEQKTLPAFHRRTGRAPKSKHEVRREMEQDPFTQMWSSIARTLQEMQWTNVADVVERQEDTLKARFHQLRARAKGTLTLNPAVAVPRYNDALDIHCMPGGYASERGEHDIFAGALYDRGSHYYGAPLLGARAHTVEDKPGWMFKERQPRLVIAAVKQLAPGFKPKKILDLGCTVGGSTIALVDAFPDAEVYGLDYAAPQLRYAHARAEAMGRRVHFIQQNAESVEFPDASFDLVTSHGLAHETSAKAIRNILRECHRLLKPGGITMHYDPQFSRGLDPHDSFMHDWDSYYNAEPFWGPLHETPVLDLLAEAGFSRGNSFEFWGSFGPNLEAVLTPADDHTSNIYRTSIFGARK